MGVAFSPSGEFFSSVGADDEVSTQQYSNSHTTNKWLCSGHLLVATGLCRIQIPCLVCVGVCVEDQF